MDDVQWLDQDSARALAFAARRLVAGRVAVVFSVRQSDDDQGLAGLAELAVRGLAGGDARALLEAAITGPLDEQVRDRIVAEAQGNPRALLELARGLTPEDLAGGFGLPSAAALPDRIEESFRLRLAPLPPATRRLLLIAAAEPVLDPMLVWRAANRLGVEDGAAAPAAAAGLIEFGRQLRFRDPLARSAVYRAATAEEANLGRGPDAPLLLLKAARRLQALHPGLAREAYRDTFRAALTTGRLPIPGGMLQAAEAVRAAAPAAPPSGARDLLLDGLAMLTTEGYAAGTPMLKRGLSAFGGERASSEEESGWLSLACRMAQDVWDDQRWHAYTTRLIGLARHAGALSVLPGALQSGVAIELLAGEPAAAAAMAGEADVVAQATGNPVCPYGSLMLAAWGGREADAGQLMAAATVEMTARGEGRWLTAAAWATAVLYNGLARYDEALAAAERGSEYPDELGLATWSVVELIEAAARIGQPERAAGALRRLSEATNAAGTDWALGIQARSRALLTGGEQAERLYREAIERLGRTRVRVELARAHLLYGEWLRRQRRRVDAREQLRSAYTMLDAMGVDGFAERARRELAAVGLTVRKRKAQAEELTAQEAQIARLVVDGHTNPQISTRLFISPRTVEWHLRKVFTKLGVSSRKELRSVLPDLEPAALPAA